MTLTWINGKQWPTQFGDWKNTTGKDGHEVVERSSDYFKRVKEEDYSEESLKVVEDMTAPERPEAFVPDNIDTCLVCGTEIPPGPDFCGDECEERAKNEPKETQ
jgi:hypothetical protein